MSNLVVLFVHAMVTVARLLGPGGVRSVVAESVLVKQQLVILNRSIVRGSGHPICAFPIAWSPVCVLSSFAAPA
jgi:hypothetical protein